MELGYKPTCSMQTSHRLQTTGQAAGHMPVDSPIETCAKAAISNESHRECRLWKNF